MTRDNLIKKFEEKFLNEDKCSSRGLLHSKYENGRLVDLKSFLRTSLQKAYKAGEESMTREVLEAVDRCFLGECPNTMRVIKRVVALVKVCSPSSETATGAEEKING